MPFKTVKVTGMRILIVMAFGSAVPSSQETHSEDSRDLAGMSCSGTETAHQDSEGPWRERPYANGIYHLDGDEILQLDQRALCALQQLLAKTRLQSHTSAKESEERRAAIKEASGARHLVRIIGRHLMKTRHGCIPTPAS